jgi:hypothetical protein
MKTLLALFVSLSLFFGMGTVNPIAHADAVVSAPVQTHTFNDNINAAVRIAIVIDIVDEEGNVIGKRDAGYGTGECIGARHILTAGHVAEPGEEFRIDLFGDDSSGLVISTRTAHIFKADYDLDLAILEIDGDDLPSYICLEPGHVVTGDKIYTVGGPLGEPARCVVWGTKTLDLGVAMISTQPGASGSSIFSEDHKFIGVLVRGAPGVILFVRADTVHEFMNAPIKPALSVGVKAKVGNGHDHKCNCGDKCVKDKKGKCHCDKKTCDCKRKCDHGKK